MAKIMCAALVLICAVLAVTQGAAIESEKTYPGFINLGSIQVAHQPEDGVGVSSILIKTLHVSTAWSTRDNAWGVCRNMPGGQLLTLGSVAEGEAVYDRLVVQGVANGVFWTAGIRDQEQWFWHVRPTAIGIPTTHFAWGPSEPRADPYYDLVVFVKSTFSYNLQTQATADMINNRYICEVISTSD